MKVWASRLCPSWCIVATRILRGMWFSKVQNGWSFVETSWDDKKGHMMMIIRGLRFMIDWWFLMMMMMMMVMMVMVQTSKEDKTSTATMLGGRSWKLLNLHQLHCSSTPPPPLNSAPQVQSQHQASWQTCRLRGELWEQTNWPILYYWRWHPIFNHLSSKKADESWSSLLYYTLWCWFLRIDIQFSLYVGGFPPALMYLLHVFIMNPLIWYLEGSLTVCSGTLGSETTLSFSHVFACPGYDVVPCHQGKADHLRLPAQDHLLRSTYPASSRLVLSMYCWTQTNQEISCWTTKWPITDVLFIDLPLTFAKSPNGRIHGMEFYELCGMLGIFTRIRHKRDLHCLPLQFRSKKTKTALEIVMMNPPLTHHSYDFRDVFLLILFLHFFPWFYLFSFHSSQIPNQAPGFGQRQDDWSLELLALPRHKEAKETNALPQHKGWPCNTWRNYLWP